MRIKGSYTVEAAIVISFCLVIFSVAIGLAYEIFKNAIEYVSYRDDSFDAVTFFRFKEGIAGVIHAIKD